MARPIGSPKLGGRKKGTPNKKTLNLMELAETLGAEPFEVLLRFVKGDWEGLGYPHPTRTVFTKQGDAMEMDVISPELRAKCAADACSYLYPKRKAIELSGNVGGPLEMFLQMSPEERARRREEIRKRLKANG